MSDNRPYDNQGGYTVERVSGLALPNRTLDAMAVKIQRFGWPYRRDARAVAIQLLAAALDEGGIVLRESPPTPQGRDDD